ncbi:IQEC3 protein, partial [Polypterus senegalus]
MESLLDNPMKAVLYLKELTTIVQNQQSLIQTQRQRIDELERRVEELIGENRQLKEQHQPHHYHHHHHHPAPRSASPQSAALPHQHPGNSKAGTHPGQQPQQPRQHPSQSQQHLQLVPATSPSPQSSPTSPDSAEDCCKSLVLQKPATICRSVVLGRKPDCEEAATHLALALEGPALQVLIDLPPEECRDLQALTDALTRRFGQRTSAEHNREELTNRHRREGESVGAFAADIRVYVRKGYPTFSTAAREELSVHAFLRALHQSVSVSTSVCCRPDI